MGDFVLDELAKIAKRYKVDGVLLYGSRARGDYSPVSDYDVAFIAEDISAQDKTRLCHAVEEIRTLKKIDVVFISRCDEDDFVRQILREGVVIYGQTED